MSTPAWKKKLNKQTHALAKAKRDYEKLFEPDPNYKQVRKAYTWNVQTRQTRHVESVSDGVGHTSKAEPKKYTGDYIVGIATMHKSNLVPVCKDDNPENYATMRRN